jgi:hypothetical protein
MYSRPKLLDFPGFPAVLFENRLILSAAHVRLLEWALALVARRKQPGLSLSRPRTLSGMVVHLQHLSGGHTKLALLLVAEPGYRVEACNESFLRLGRQNEFGSASR